MISTNIFREVSIFKEFGQKDLELLLTCASEKQFDPDTVLLKESDHSTDLYFIVSGRVSVEMELPTAIDFKSYTERLSIIKAGEIFGEIAFIEGTPRSAQIRSIEDVHVLIFDSEKLYEVFDNNPVLGYKVMRDLAVIVCDRLKETNLMWRNIVINSIG